MAVGNKNKRSFGTEGENAAAQFLVENNYNIITRNFRVGKLGEIDIIAQDNEYICFVEVKTRSSTLFGMPSEAVTRRKRDNIVMLASVYVERHKLHDCNMRFDVVEVMVRDGKNLDINLIKNAF